MRSTIRSASWRCSPVWSILALIGTAILLVVTPARADIPHRAVYRDPHRYTSWLTQPDADIVARFFKAAGYTVLDAQTLDPWLKARTADRQRSVLVCANDVLPDEALNPVPGSVSTPSANNDVRRYLLSGGRLVMAGDIPFYLHAADDQRIETGWQLGGSLAILGMNAAAASTATGQPYEITSEGRAWGLTAKSIEPSLRPTLPEDVDIVLAKDSVGNASSWIKYFTNVPGRGEFIRLWDDTLSPDQITPAFLADLQHVAEHNVPGQVSTPLTNAITGSVQTPDGRLIVGVSVVISGGPGFLPHPIQIASATDGHGSFFAILRAGK